MKSISTSIAVGAMLTALAVAQPRRYDIIDLGPVGAPPGQPITIADNGLISGSATVADGSVHAMLWYRGWRADFGKPGLGGPNSVAFGVNDRGQAVGEAETSHADPNGEDFCGFKALGHTSTANTCLPFFWQYGVMTKLPTLGGPNGVANLLNNSGEIAGAAENTTFDKACPAPQMLQFKPVVWQKGKVQELPTAASDPEGIAFAINDNGQVVGASGDCTTFNPLTYVNLQPLHALLWEQGKVTDLGNLGGTGHGFGIEALGINSQGQVVGVSDISGDAVFHAFLWTKQAGMKDLGTLPGGNPGDPADAASSAIGINQNGEVVGISLDATFNGRAFHWQNGTMTDLNGLVRENRSGLFLVIACFINSRSEIIGLAFDSGGNAHGYLAVPRFADSDGETAAPSTSAKIDLPENVRALVQQRLGFARTGARLGRRQ